MSVLREVTRLAEILRAVSQQLNIIITDENPLNVESGVIDKLMEIDDELIQPVLEEYFQRAG